MLFISIKLRIDVKHLVQSINQSSIYSTICRERFRGSSFMPNTHRLRRRNSTVELRRIENWTCWEFIQSSWLQNWKLDHGCRRVSTHYTVYHPTQFNSTVESRRRRRCVLGFRLRWKCRVALASVDLVVLHLPRLFVEWITVTERVNHLVCHPF